MRKGGAVSGSSRHIPVHYYLPVLTAASPHRKRPSHDTTERQRPPVPVVPGPVGTGTGANDRYNHALFKLIHLMTTFWTLNLLLL